MSSSYNFDYWGSTSTVSYTFTYERNMMIENKYKATVHWMNEDECISYWYKTTGQMVKKGSPVFAHVRDLPPREDKNKPNDDKITEDN